MIVTRVVTQMETMMSLRKMSRTVTQMGIMMPLMIVTKTMTLKVRTTDPTRRTTLKEIKTDPMKKATKITTETKTKIQMAMMRMLETARQMCSSARTGLDGPVKNSSSTRTT